MGASGGLGNRYWPEVIEVLRSIIPVYDKVNKVISFGKDEEYRLRGIRGRVMTGDAVLDAGSGYGNMTRIAFAEAGEKGSFSLYDPIPEMLSSVHNYLDRRIEASLYSGVFEHIPFRENAFDVVMCGYSLRDAIQLREAISEMHRVLKSGGRLIIVDLGKPDGTFQRMFVSAYLKYFLGISAYFVAGKAGLRFRTLYGTYLRWPKNSELESMLKEKFSRVDFEREMMGGAIIVAAYK